MWVYTRAFLTKMANRLATPAGADSVAFNTFRIGLLKAAFAPTVDSVYGDVSASIADYTGYGDVSVGGPGTPFIGTDDLTYIQGTLNTFRPNDAVNPNTIYAAFLTGVGSESATLFGVEVLDEPVPLPDSSHALDYVPRFGWDPAANWGNSISGA